MKVHVVNRDLYQLRFDLVRARVSQRRPVGELHRGNSSVAAIDRADELRGRTVVFDVDLVVSDSVGRERCFESKAIATP